MVGSPRFLPKDKTKSDIPGSQGYVKIGSNIFVKGYDINYYKLFGIWLLIVFTCGLFGLYLFWKRSSYVKLTHSYCALQKCSKVLVKDGYGNLYVEKVKIYVATKDGYVTLKRHNKYLIKNAEENSNFFEIPLPIDGRLILNPILRIFNNRKSTFIFTQFENTFYDVSDWATLSGISPDLLDYLICNKRTHAQTLPDPNPLIKSSEFVEFQVFNHPLPPKSLASRMRRLLVFGQNDLYIPVPGFFKIMYDEVLTPFYAFQAFSVILWYNDDYWFYATCVLLISLMTLFKSTYDIRKERLKLNHSLSIAKNVAGKEDKRCSIGSKEDKKIPLLKQTVLVERSYPQGFDEQHSTDNVVSTIAGGNKKKPKTHYDETVESNFVGDRCFYHRVPVDQIVPGDVILIEFNNNDSSSDNLALNGYNVPCDAVILDGSCITNECMLTGESVPVTKSPFECRRRSDQYGIGFQTAEVLESQPMLMNYDRNSALAKHVIFNGTRILQIRCNEDLKGYLKTDASRARSSNALRAYVIATGFNTAKGRMVKDFLYPAPSVFKFDQDSFKFIAALFGLSIIGFVYSLILKILQQVPVKQLIIRSLDLIAIVVPPALPAAMTAGLIFAQKRLKRNHAVVCLSPEKINASGALDVLCFDKTGTLTYDGLDITGVLPVFTVAKRTTVEEARSGDFGGPGNDKPAFHDKIVDGFDHSFSDIHQGATTDASSMASHMVSSITDLSICCAVCHSIVKIREQLMGDPLETKMFSFSQWTYAGDDIQALFGGGSCGVTWSRELMGVLSSSNRRTGHEEEDLFRECDPNDSLSPAVLFVARPPEWFLLSEEELRLRQSTAASGCPPQLYHDKDASENRLFFEAYCPSAADKHQYGVIHLYPFIHALQRMSVVVRRLTGSHFELFSKGSPETIYSLCDPSTLPPNYETVLDELTHNGYRVIACARKTLYDFKLTSLKRISRQEIEKDLEFIGFLVFQNKLKPQTTPTMDTLNEAGFKNVMVTGDNLLTALTVANECHLIPKGTKQVLLVKAILLEQKEEEPGRGGTLKITLIPKRLNEAVARDSSDSSQKIDEKFSNQQSEGGGDDQIGSFLLKYLLQKLWLPLKQYFVFSKSEIDDDDIDDDTKKVPKPAKSVGNLFNYYESSHHRDAQNANCETNYFKNDTTLFDPHVFYNRARQYLSVMLCHLAKHDTYRVNNTNVPSKCSNSCLEATSPIDFPASCFGDPSIDTRSSEDTYLPHYPVSPSKLSPFYAMGGQTFELLDMLSRRRTAVQENDDLKVEIYVQTSGGEARQGNDVILPVARENLIFDSVLDCLKRDIGDITTPCPKTNNAFVRKYPEINSSTTNKAFHEASKISLLNNKGINKNDNLKIANKQNGCTTTTLEAYNSSKLLLSEDSSRNAKRGEFKRDEHSINMRNVSSPSYYDDFLDAFLVDNCCVFARMSPEAKTRLISRFQSLDYYVGMCGDGANDCGALKAAHMGVSLAPLAPDETNDANDDDDEHKGNEKISKIGGRRKKPTVARSAAPVEATASLAAPFTATRSDISCLPGIIREGRASLTTSFGVFKNMACYSLNQFLACLSLYWFGTNFSDVQFAFSDFFPATVLSMLMGNTKSYPTLPKIINNNNVPQISRGKSSVTTSTTGQTREIVVPLEERSRYAQFERFKPDTSLALVRHVGSVVGHIVINIAFLAGALTYTYKQPWCVKHVNPIIDLKNPYYPHLVAAVFFVTFYQYVSFTVIFSKGPPFRRPYYTNIPLVSVTIAIVLFCAYLTLREPFTYPIISHFFRLTYPPRGPSDSSSLASLATSAFYLGLAFTNFLVSLTFERIILDHYLLRFSRGRNLFFRKVKPPAHTIVTGFSERFLPTNNF